MQFKVVILSIPAHLPRTFSCIGHLETMGFDVKREVKIHTGVDCREDLRAYGEEMIRDGFDRGWIESLLSCQRPAALSSAMAYLFGHLTFLKKCVAEPNPVLFMSSDVLLRLTRKELLHQFDNLFKLAGYENVNVAHLTSSFQRRCDVPPEPLDDFWVRGSMGYAGTCTLWTSHGAQSFLDLKTGQWVGPFFQNPQDYGFEGVFSTKECHTRFGWASKFDSNWHQVPDESWQIKLEDFDYKGVTP